MAKFTKSGSPAAPADTDAAGVEVRSSAVLSNSYEASTAIDMRHHNEAHWVLAVTNKGSCTSIEVQIEASDVASPGVNDWATVTSEAVAAGVATLSDYTLTKDISSVSAPFNLVYKANARCRWMRAKVKATGTVTSSLASMRATRKSGMGTG